jgi:ATP-dependent exoDNAse (exonuclease V) alpha subunit
MAIYFLNMTSVGRSSGSSAVSAAAYRSGERIRDERTGRTYDHTEREDVLHKEIMVPEQFSGVDMSWARDRGNLWNLAESLETRRNSRVAREYLVALPAELSPEDRINLVSGFSRELVERYRFALDMTVHAPRDYPGSDPRNFHAHLLATTREVQANGLGPKTAMEWSDSMRRRHALAPAAGELLHVRERWALSANAALERAHINARIDHRTLEAQGIDREPAPRIPRVAFEMERQGYHSFVAERIRAQHQSRVEARQRAVQQSKIPEDPARRSALEWRRIYIDGRSKEEREKTSEQLRIESAMRWKRYRDSQRALEQERSPEKERSRARQKDSRSLDDDRHKDHGLDLSL